MSRDIDRIISELIGEKSDVDLDREADEMITRFTTLLDDPEYASCKQEIEQTILTLRQIKQHRMARKQLDQEAP